MKFFSVIMFFLLVSVGLTAQFPDLKMRYFNQKEGLSSTFVTSVVQDSVGYLWVGTSEGLNRFDGMNFTSYGSGDGLLPHQSIETLMADSGGDVWVATAEGLVLYQAECDCFKEVVFEGKVAGEFAKIVQLDIDRAGTVYAAEGSKLYRYNSSRKMFEIFYTAKQGQITGFAFDRANMLWFTTAYPSSLIGYHIQSGREFIYRPDMGNIPEKPLTALVHKDEGLWLGTLGQGTWYFDLHQRAIRLVDAGQNGSEFVTRMYVDRHDRLWRVDYVGLNLFDDASGRFLSYPYQIQSPYVIRNSVSGIFQDLNDNYWVYHHTGGLGLSVRPKGFYHINDQSYNPWHLSANRVSAIQANGRGQLWFAHAGFAIDVFNSQRERVQQITAASTGVPLQSITMLYGDPQGHMWVGSYNRGLLRYLPSSGRFEQFMNDPSNPLSIANNDVRSMVYDPDGYYWLVTHGAGVDRFDMKTKRFDHFTSTNSNLSNEWTNQVVLDRKGNLWVATAWGLNIKNRGATRFQRFYSQKSDVTTISGNNVVTVFEDVSGAIWVGTDRGLSRYNHEDNNFVRINSQEINGSICAITEDADGNLWLSTMSGLIRVNKSTHQVRHFDESDGVQPDEFLPRSVFRDSLGVIYFGGIRGVTYFDPAKLTFNATPPPVVLTTLKLGGELIMPGHASQLLKRQINYAKIVRIDHNHRVMTIGYHAINFNNPDRNRYAVKLEGFDKDWQMVGNQTSATYTNLTPGKYIFRVKAANNDGVWNEKGASVEIIVDSPWYSSWWARIISVLILIGGIWFFMRFRTQSLLKQKIILSQMVRAKTEELEASNQELMAQAEYLDNLNKLLEERQSKLETQSRLVSTQALTLRKQNDELKQLNKTKDRLFSIIAHDLINPFNSIIGLSEVFKEEYSHLNESERRELMTTINISANRIFALLQNLLLWARSQTNSVKFNQSSFLLHDVLVESTDFLAEMLSRKGLLLQIDCPASLYVYADPDMVKTIVRNLVSNAIKFSFRETTIRVECVRMGKKAVVSVIDHGTGMDDATVEKLMARQPSHTTVGTEGEPGTGLGLLICREFVEWHKGEFRITSKPGEGSTFTFTLPVYRVEE